MIRKLLVLLFLFTGAIFITSGCTDTKPQPNLSCKMMITILKQSGYTNLQIKNQLHLSQGGKDCSKELGKL